MKNYVDSLLVTCEREEKRKESASNYYTEKQCKRSSYSVKSNVQKQIATSREEDICHVSGAPRCERER